MVPSLLLLLCLVAFFPAPAKGPAAADKAELAAYLKAHWASPEDYVVGKFKDHDIVFVGEYHRIKHDALLIQALIPKLYKAGITNLGMEFADYSDQALIDKLVDADSYDEDLARKITFDQFVFWGYKEYMDVFRAAWALNHSLPKGAPRFRVVGLNYSPNWKLMTVPKDQLTDELRKKIFYNGDGDEYMGGVILKEFVEKGQKALIYSGSHHAFTRYRQPNYDFDKKVLRRLVDDRMGNIVNAKIGARAFNIFLHSPWATRESFEKDALPVRGVVDEVMEGFEDKRVGFDTAGTPFGKLEDPGTYYAIGHEGFKLEDFCDGYIYQKAFKDYEGVTTDPLFITEKNLKEATENLPNPDARAFLKTPADFIRGMRHDADIPARFKRQGIIPDP